MHAAASFESCSWTLYSQAFYPKFTTGNRDGCEPVSLFEDESWHSVELTLSLRMRGDGPMNSSPAMPTAVSMRVPPFCCRNKAHTAATPPFFHCDPPSDFGVVEREPSYALYMKIKFEFDDGLFSGETNAGGFVEDDPFAPAAFPLAGGAYIGFTARTGGSTNNHVRHFPWPCSQTRWRYFVCTFDGGWVDCSLAVGSASHCLSRASPTTTDADACHQLHPGGRCIA